MMFDIILQIVLIILAITFGIIVIGITWTTYKTWKVSTQSKSNTKKQ